MPQVADELSRALTRLANDRRRTVAHYGNVTARPGRSQIPQRLLSDTGFFTDLQFSYIASSPANITEHSEPRTPVIVVLRPYGLREDVQRLTSSEDQDRVERTNASLGSSGITHYSGSNDFVMSADLDSGTVSLQKTLNVVRQITDTRGGPSYHAVINRRGDIIVSATIDQETMATPSRSQVSIDVAIETAVVMTRADHATNNFTKLIELPFTSIQLTTLAILFAKLRTAYQFITQTIVRQAVGSGLSYVWSDDELQRYNPYGLIPLNFSSEQWKDKHPSFDYSFTDAIQFFGRVTSQGAFDLATEIFRSDQQAPPTSAREVVRTAIGTVDTGGAQAVYLGAYASIASQDRNTDLQSVSRRTVFVQRAGVAHHDADAASQTAGEVTEGAEATSEDDEETGTVVGTGPHVYDFESGLWQDSPNPKAY